MATVGHNAAFRCNQIIFDYKATSLSRNARPAPPHGLDTDDAVRALLLLLPRLVGRAKKLAVPPQLQSMELAPRHLSLLSYLLFDGPMTVNELAARLEIAPTTASLMVNDLSRKGVLDRREDDHDRRRRIVTIAPTHEAAIRAWRAQGANAWQRALAPLTSAERATVVGALRAYEANLAG